MEEASRQEGCELYDWEFVGGQGAPVLRVFIDRDPAGVSIDDCANVSRCLNLLLDSEDLISQSYELEVSSPGLERPLRQGWHFAKAVGGRVKVKAHDFVASNRGQRSKSFQGLLRSFADGQLVVEDEQGQLWQVHLGEIDKARTQFVFPKSGSGSGRVKRKKEDA